MGILFELHFLSPPRPSWGLRYIWQFFLPCSVSLLHSLPSHSPTSKRLDPICLGPLCPTNLLLRLITFQASPTSGLSLESILQLNFIPVTDNNWKFRLSTPSTRLFKKELSDTMLTRSSIQIYSLEHQSPSRYVYFKVSYNIRSSYYFIRLHRYTYYTLNFLVGSRDWAVSYYRTQQL